MKKMKKVVALLLLGVMLVTGCGAAETKSDVLKNGDVIGSGDTSFDFVIVDEEESEIKVEVKTDEETVGDALQKLHVISGTEGDYGLFVDTVNGITADYEKDQVYWAFYIDDEYAQEGISMTKIDPDSTYMMKIEEALAE